MPPRPPLVDAEQLVHQQERVPGPSVSAQHKPGECRPHLVRRNGTSHLRQLRGSGCRCGRGCAGRRGWAADEDGAEDAGVLGEAGADVVGVGAGQADVGEAEDGDGVGEADERRLGDADADALAD